ncbi:hypothetical protein GALL_546780 [mine drainage metagenome]|uniref:Uncharacterized protein n=1 Tax=mine drainage metagenome TaxID=410659 RepID=A0A1J5PJS2_9ZZZZ
MIKRNFQYSQIRVGVRANNFGAGVTAVVEDDLNFIGSLNHVVIGQDVAVGTDDDTAAQAHLGLVLLFAKKELEPWVILLQSLAGIFAGADADNGRG